LDDWSRAWEREGSMTEVERAVIDPEKTKILGPRLLRKDYTKQKVAQMMRTNTDQITSRKGKNLRFGRRKGERQGKTTDLSRNHKPTRL
jgi:hypothetical protein